MTVLRRMNVAEFDSWLANAVPVYAAEKVASGHWNKDDAQERSLKEHQELLPLGLASEGNHFFVILDTGAQTVGCLWFAVKTKFSLPIAYHYCPVERASPRRIASIGAA